MENDNQHDDALTQGASLARLEGRAGVRGLGIAENALAGLCESGLIPLERTGRLVRAKP